MKKVYLFILALFFTSVSFGQKTAVKAIPFKVKMGESTKPATQIPQDKGATIWSNDFSVPADWTIANSGTPSSDWVIGSSGPTGTFSSTYGTLTSTSGGNFALFDSDALGSVGAIQDATVTITNPISTIGNPAVILQFESLYSFFTGGAAFLEVSNDGVNFTQFQVHQDVGVNMASDNPTLIRVNISTVAGNQANVWIRFRYTGSFEYAWMVDDVEIQVADNNDIVTSSPFYGLNAVPYTRIPANHIQPMDVSMLALNNGSVNQTNTVLTIEDNGVAVSTGTPDTLFIGDTDSLFAPAYTLPSALGIPHVITLRVTSDSADITPADNVQDFQPIEITTDLYAMDDFGANGVGNGGGENLGSPGSFEFEAGNSFDAVVNDVAGSITVVIGSNAPVGTVIDFVLYEIDATGNFVEVSRSDFYTTTAADAGNEKELALVNPTPNPTITAGTSYFAAVHAFSEFFYGTSGTSPDNNSPGGTQSFIFYPNMSTPNTGENFFTSQTPMVRLNTRMYVGIEELNKNINFSVSPNPSRDIFNINIDAQTTENINLSVRNIIGQTILSKVITVSGQTKESISLSDYDKGIYFLTIDNNKEKRTIKLIVE